MCFPGLRKPIHEVHPQCTPKSPSPNFSVASTTDISKTPSKMSMMSVSSSSPSSTTVSSTTLSASPSQWPSGIALLQSSYIEEDNSQVSYSNNQYCFRPKHSSKYAALELIYRIITEMDKMMYLLTYFFTFQRHLILLTTQF